jgi:hypothetical protein
MPEQIKFNSLNTSFVNLSSFIRFLREQGFRGRMHVTLDEYEADIFLYGSETPSVWENDLSAGRESQGEAAMQRLLVRAREPGGVITLFEEAPAEVTTSGDHFAITDEVRNQLEKFESDLSALLPVSSQIIAAVERATTNAGASFNDNFNRARIELGDDYPFLDPTVGGFEYKETEVTLDSKPSATTYAQGVSEILNRVVNYVAEKENESRFRELVAAELAVTVRRLPGGAGEFTNQLNRIAGTRVL